MASLLVNTFELMASSWLPSGTVIEPGPIAFRCPIRNEKIPLLVAKLKPIDVPLEDTAATLESNKT